MQIRWSPEAADDFESAIRRVPPDNPSNAQRTHIIDDRVAALTALSNRDRIGRVEGTRELVSVPLPLSQFMEFETNALKWRAGFMPHENGPRNYKAVTWNM